MDTKKPMRNAGSLDKGVDDGDGWERNLGGQIKSAYCMFGRKTEVNH